MTDNRPVAFSYKVVQLILGHGIDLVDIVDMRRWIDDVRNPLLSRCFTNEELKMIERDAVYYERIAGRYAAKEAVLKALGTGYGNGVSFKCVEIFRSPGEAPKVSLNGAAETKASDLGIKKWIISISHTHTFATASALALSE
jgi:holo-[acyl-carrier protein] synthase